MRRGRLPLTALRSFEATGRLLSITAAAEELCVSQAAVSRQVRELERQPGVALLVRLHRGLRLTGEGRALLEVLSRAFDDLDDTLHRLRKPPHAPIRLSVEPAFAAPWLVPRLPRFQASHPEAEILLDADHRLADLSRDRVTLAIRYSLTDSHWPGSESRPLGAVWLSPYLAPALAGSRRLDRPVDLVGLPRLHEEDRDLWARRFTTAGVDGPPTDRGTVFNDAGLLLQATIPGQGVALLDDHFAAPALREGALLRPCDVSLPFGHDWLLARDFDRLPAPAADFARWLLTETSADQLAVAATQQAR